MWSPFLGCSLYHASLSTRNLCSISTAIGLSFTLPACKLIYEMARGIVRTGIVVTKRVSKSPASFTDATVGASEMTIRSGGAAAVNVGEAQQLLPLHNHQLQPHRIVFPSNPVLPRAEGTVLGNRYHMALPQNRFLSFQITRQLRNDNS